VESEMKVYCDKSPSHWVSIIESVLEKNFEEKQVLDPDLMRPEGGVLLFEDVVTPKMYYTRADETLHNLHHFYASIKLLNDLLKSFGIGPILSVNQNNRYPFKLSYAATSAFEYLEDNETNTCEVMVKMVPNISINDESIIGKLVGNSNVSIERFGLRNSIPGGILFDFISLLQQSMLYRDFMNIIEKYPDFDEEIVLNGMKKSKLENMVLMGLNKSVLVTGTCK